MTVNVPACSDVVPVTWPRRPDRSPAMSPMFASGQSTSRLTIGSSTIGRAFSIASRNALRPAVTNATSFESTGMVLAVVDDHAHVLQRKAGDRRPWSSTCSTPFCTAGMNWFGIAPPLTSIDELEARAARQRLDAQIHFAELARAAGLLLVAVMAFGLAR